jgi:hypothetical protein
MRRSTSFGGRYYWGLLACVLFDGGERGGEGELVCARKGGVVVYDDKSIEVNI